MNAKKRSSARRSVSDLPKVDAHKIQPHEYHDAPEMTTADLAGMTRERGGQPVKRGRPKSETAKEAVKLRLDPDVLRHFRSTGEGWQTRINAALRRSAKLPKAVSFKFAELVPDKGTGEHRVVKRRR